MYSSRCDKKQEKQKLMKLLINTKLDLLLKGVNNKKVCFILTHIQLCQEQFSYEC